MRAFSTSRQTWSRSLAARYFLSGSSSSSSSEPPFFIFPVPLLLFFFIIIARLLSFYVVAVVGFFSRAFRNSRYVRWFGVNGPTDNVLMQGRTATFFFFFHFPPLSPPPPPPPPCEFTMLEAMSSSGGEADRGANGGIRLVGGEKEKVGRWAPGKAARMECNALHTEWRCCCCCCFSLSLSVPGRPSRFPPSTLFFFFPPVAMIAQVRSPAQVKAHGNDTATSSKQPPFLLLFLGRFGCVDALHVSVSISRGDTEKGWHHNYCAFSVWWHVPCFSTTTEQCQWLLELHVCYSERKKGDKMERKKQGRRRGAKSVPVFARAPYFEPSRQCQPFLSRYCACG